MSAARKNKFLLSPQADAIKILQEDIIMLYLLFFAVMGFTKCNEALMQLII